MAGAKQDTIRCDFCAQSYDYEEDGTLECLPDGYFLPEAKWICQDCGGCPECGRTLEKEQHKRGPDAQPCRYCTGEIYK